MSIIDHTYFTRETLIGGIEQQPIQDIVCKFIAEYEPIFLRECMGYEFSKLFLEQIALAPTSGRWYDIVSGCEYEHNGVTCYWEGLKIPAIKRSIIADYVYYWYCRNNFSQTARMGEVKGKTENSAMHNPNQKMADAWNRMSNQIPKLHALLLSSVDGERTYPEYSSRWNCELLPINVFGI